MKILISIVALGLWSVTSFAAEAKVTCNVKNQKDADVCMQKVADATPLGSDSDSNLGIASPNWGPTVTVLNGVGVDEESIQIAKNADFAGAVLQGDYAEDHIIYYAVKKGRNVTPVKLHDQNLVDLSTDLPKKLKKNSPLANPNTYVLGFDCKQYTDFNDTLKAEFKEIFDAQEN